MPPVIPPAPALTLREPTQVIQDNGVRLAQAKAKEVGILCGPIPCGSGNRVEQEEVLKLSIMPWAINCETGGGGHGLNRCRSRAAIVKKGKRATIGCNLRSKSCHWELEYEETTEG